MRIKKIKLKWEESRVLSIDPGLNGTGWVVAFLNRNGQVNIIRSGIINEKNGTLEERAGAIAAEIVWIANRNNVSRICCEYPAFFDSVSGQMVAKRGDLVKLTFLIGYIAGMLHEFGKCELIPVNEWKGQLPKSVINERVKQILGEKRWNLLGLKSHAVDACGIALFVLGLMK